MQKYLIIIVTLITFLFNSCQTDNTELIYDTKTNTKEEISTSNKTSTTSGRIFIIVRSNTTPTEFKSIISFIDKYCNVVYWSPCTTTHKYLLDLEDVNGLDGLPISSIQTIGETTTEIKVEDDDVNADYIKLFTISDTPCSSVNQEDEI